MENENKTVLNVMDRGGPKVVAAAQHKNNQLNLRAVFYMVAAVLIIVGLLYYMAFATSPQSNGVRPVAAAATSTRIPIDLKIGAPFESVVPVPAPTQVVEVAPAPTLLALPLVTPVPREDVQIVVKPVWRKWAANARTSIGLHPSIIDGWGVACPDVFPLGTRLHVIGGQVFTCVDATKMGCTGGVCQIWLYTSDVARKPGLVRAFVEFPAKSWQP